MVLIGIDPYPCQKTAASRLGDTVPQQWGRDILGRFGSRANGASAAALLVMGVLVDLDKLAVIKASSITFSNLWNSCSFGKWSMNLVVFPDFPYIYISIYIYIFCCPPSYVCWCVWTPLITRLRYRKANKYTHLYAMAKKTIVVSLVDHFRSFTYWLLKIVLHRSTKEWQKDTVAWKKTLRLGSLNWLESEGPVLMILGIFRVEKHLANLAKLAKWSKSLSSHLIFSVIFINSQNFRK